MQSLPGSVYQQFIAILFLIGISYAAYLVVIQLTSKVLVGPNTDSEKNLIIGLCNFNFSFKGNDESKFMLYHCGLGSTVFTLGLANALNDH